MFLIHHLKGNTYYLAGPTNIGLYKLNERDCILIDTCYAGKMTKSLIFLLEQNDLHVKGILNTHGHVDHYGSNALLKKKYGCIVAAPSIENMFIEQPHLSSLIIFPSAPFSYSTDMLPEGTGVDALLDSQTFKIYDAVFNILSLGGHSQNQKGIITPDGIIFVGDTFVGKDELEQIKLLYNYDTSKAISTMKSLLDTSFECYVPSHGKPVKDIHDTVNANLTYIENMAIQLLSLINKQPLGIDEIMGLLVSKYNITQHITNYYIAQSCITSILSYLENSNRIKIVFERGTLKFAAN